MTIEVYSSPRHCTVNRLKIEFGDVIFSENDNIVAVTKPYIEFKDTMFVYRQNERGQWFSKWEGKKEDFPITRVREVFKEFCEYYHQAKEDHKAIAKEYLKLFKKGGIEI